MRDGDGDKGWDSAGGMRVGEEDRGRGRGGDSKGYGGKC